jgi:hypothetical protein
VAHRIVERDGRQLITRGDSLRRNDLPVHEDQVLGRVVSISRSGRAISPDFTCSRRMSAWVLRRSDFAGRVLLRLVRFSSCRRRATVISKDADEIGGLREC